jgi:hypothetical protein
MVGHIFTTEGWMPSSSIRWESAVTYEDDKVQVVRRDKYLVSDGKWVGNDIEINVKQGVDIGAVANTLG